jgi:hypothetical protein
MNFRLTTVLLLCFYILSCESKVRPSKPIIEPLPDKNSTATIILKADSLNNDTSTFEPSDTVLLVENNIETTRPVIKSNQKVKSSKPAIKYLKEKAIISWDSVEINLGSITEGDIIVRKFYFTNTGMSPLQIQKALPSCGCTLPTFPFISIAPGERGYIGVSYNSVGKEGSQLPEILIYSNAAKSEDRIAMRVFVKPKLKSAETDRDSID